ncbi:MAG: type III secretion system inner membrane ring subunit SctD [Duodenibacillus sp.]|nr:type III secretion system inner membrane ring subunit SctD [Duodenibacillus sp.]
MAGIEIRILSGLHLGARIDLTPGTWVLGSDESCDLILSDSGLAARHCAFDVLENGTVRVTPLDAALLTAAGDEVPAGDIPAGNLYRMAGVLFAWGAEDAPEAFWESVALVVQQLSQPAKAAAPQPDEVSPRESAPAPAPAADEAAPEAIEADEKTQPPAPKGGAGRKTLLAAAAAVVLCAAGFWVISSPGLVPENDEGWVELTENTGRLERARHFLSRFLSRETPSASSDILMQAIAEGFSNLAVKRLENGAYVVTGSVADDEARGRLVALARKMRVPVILDVTVDSDYTRAVETAFNTLDFWPAVELAKKDSGDELTVCAYMLDSVIEEKAFSDAAVSVPFIAEKTTLRPMTVRRRIVHRPEVSRALHEAFGKAGLTGVRVDYLPGRVKFTTTLTPQTRPVLDEALRQAQDKCGVPLRMEVVNLADSTPGRMQAALAAPAVKADVDPMKSAFRVTSVSRGAIKFVTLATGEKVFAGGRLPGGFTLESVSHDRLILSKHNKRIVYPLKVKK